MSLSRMCPVGGDPLGSKPAILLLGVIASMLLGSDFLPYGPVASGVIGALLSQRAIAARLLSSQPADRASEQSVRIHL